MMLFDADIRLKPDTSEACLEARPEPRATNNAAEKSDSRSQQTYPERR
jgi:hypothetical protein